MAKFPSLPSDGEPVERTIREIIDYLRLVTLKSFVGGFVSKEPGGTTIEIDTKSLERKLRESGGASGHIRFHNVHYNIYLSGGSLTSTKGDTGSYYVKAVNGKLIEFSEFVHVADDQPDYITDGSWGEELLTIENINELLVA